MMLRISNWLRWMALAASLGAALTGAAEAQEGKRVALIVGNDAYEGRPLQNAVNDARAMDKALQGAGFKTILKENATKAELDEAVAELASQLGPDDTALFFYAGHGVQIADENFLVPVDFKPANSIAVAKARCVSFPQIVELLKQSRVKKTIMILDACRSNPLGAGQAMQGGLANPPNLGSETFLAFSTSPNHVAADNPNGRNSYFTEALASLISKSGLTIEDVFRRVTGIVEGETEKRQTPWVQSNLSTRFYFHPPENVETESDPTMIEKWMEDAKLREQRQDWDQAIELINQVLAKKPVGSTAALAQQKLTYLTARRDAQQRFDSGDFGGAAKLYEQALALDPFSIDAAFQSADSYLLNDQLAESVRLLKAARVRGSSLSSARADSMLKELAAVSPEAATELRSGIPQPPPIQELFKDVQFGAPDFDAGRRYLESTPVDLSARAKELMAQHPLVPVAAPPSPATTAAEPAHAANPPISLESLHVEVLTTSATRDLTIRKLGEPEKPAPYGFVQFDGMQDDMAVLLDGKPVTQQRAKVQLPAGAYQVRLVKQGSVLGSQEIEVKPLAVVSVVVK